MKLRVLNAVGMAEADLVLDRLRSGELENVPAALLESDDFSDSVEADIRRPKDGEIQSRWMLGVWLWRELQPVANNSMLVAHPGLWTWLAFVLFDTIAPVRAHGRIIRDDAKYILARGDYRKYYRHLLAGPYLLVRTHSNEPHVVRGLLATPPDSPGDVYEQLASRPQIVNSSAAVALATSLYYDAEAKQLRRGAAGAGPGSVRRYAAILMQYDVTFDLVTITTSKLLAMLPKEFARFRDEDMPTAYAGDVPTVGS